MMKKISRYYHTIKHLRLIQIRYQIWYRIRNHFFPVKYPKGNKAPSYQKIRLYPFPPQYTHYHGSNHFQFLNLEHDYRSQIYWNFLGHGKLWAYHLNYFDFLHQENMDRETGIALVYDFLRNPDLRSEGLEPYPISLRTINWIKFMSNHNYYSQKIVNSLYAQYQVLSKKIEYHLMANHLLENGFSLLFGAVFFQDEKLIRLTKKILKSELEEQILRDGAHFELSPMYHVILLQRALDGYNLLRHNQHDLHDIEKLLKAKIQLMVNWLDMIMLSNGDIPMLNDSTVDQALNPKIILKYAIQLGFHLEESKLTDSGYRKLKIGEFELIADVGKVGPSYQPGHAHADTLSFVLYHKGKPVIVDRGISTYEKNRLRDEERGTASHNTVVVNGEELTDVWGGFRVGRRAKCTILQDDPTHLEAIHTGYQYIGVSHNRRWKLKEGSIEIQDVVHGNPQLAIAYYHLSPNLQPEINDSSEVYVHDLLIKFEGQQNILVEDYLLSVGFNKRIPAKKITIIFENQLFTQIKTTYQ